MVIKTSDREIAVVVLGAGQGTRMKSDVPKVLHPIGGSPMLHHVLATASQLGATKMVVVVGAANEQALTDAAKAFDSDIKIAVQDPPLGTAHAVRAAQKHLQGFKGDVFVLYADTPLIKPETLTAMLDERDNGSDVVVLGFDAFDPGAYGRLITNDAGRLSAIVEAKDATPEELAVTFCNSGVMVIDGVHLLNLLEQVSNDNAKGEYYLTDIVEIANKQGLTCGVVQCPEDEVLGVNSRVELADAEAIFQARMRREAMQAGVTLLDPETVYFSADTELGRDVVVGQNVVFGPGVTIEDGVVIQPFCHFQEAHVAAQATLGPYARLRPGADVGAGAHIGNFVEIKKSTIEEGAKVNHLTYIGDSFVGAKANIGAGTITCNYDGFDKFKTHIGRGAFIGSNNSLVAPVTIGDGAFTGSGSVITKDVEGDALAVERSPQKNLQGWAEKFRAKKRRTK